MKIKVLFVCTGLGNINRGFESFTRECFEHLKSNPEFHLVLAKGAGEKKLNEIVIPNFSRLGKAATILSKIFKSKDAYFFEQVSFFVGILPFLLKFKPDVIYFSDYTLGTYFYHLRKKLGLKYKLLFSNGAPNGPPFKCIDHVQQLLDYHYNIAIQAGEPPPKHEVIPYGVDIELININPAPIHIINIRQDLGLPTDKKIILSVGAINSHHKRMDYLIREFSKLDPRHHFLVLLGQSTEGSEEIYTLASSLLPKDSYQIKSVAQEQVKMYYQVSNVFVLASLAEGLPRVILEATSFGLAVVCHDYGINRETLQEFGEYVDMSKEGILSNKLIDFFSSSEPKEIGIKRNLFIHHNYSWESLAPRYVTLMKNAFASPYR